MFRFYLLIYIIGFFSAFRGCIYLTAYVFIHRLCVKLDIWGPLYGLNAVLGSVKRGVRGFGKGGFQVLRFSRRGSAF